MALGRPAFLGEWLPATHPRQPPGMTWEDWQAWRPWLAGPGARWEAYAYDVVLYVQPLAEVPAAPEILAMWARNNARRIDAVAVGPRGLDLFEARRLPGPSAYGQLLLYAMFWKLTLPDLPLGHLWLIAESCDDSVRATAATLGIHTWCVGEDTVT